MAFGGRQHVEMDDVLLRAPHIEVDDVLLGAPAWADEPAPGPKISVRMTATLTLWAGLWLGGWLWLHGPGASLPFYPGEHPVSFGTVVGLLALVVLPLLLAVKFLLMVRHDRPRLDRLLLPGWGGRDPPNCSWFGPHYFTQHIATVTGAVMVGSVLLTLLMCIFQGVVLNSGAPTYNGFDQCLSRVMATQIPTVPTLLAIGVRADGE